MDILETIKTVVETIMKDGKLLENFKINPLEVVKSIIGGDFSADALKEIVDGVTKQLTSAGALGDLAEAAKDALGDAAADAKGAAEDAAGAAKDAAEGAADTAKDAAEDAADGIGGIIGKGLEALKKIF